MQEFRFSCPSCGAKLRVRGRGYLQRPLPCPDCDAVLRIREDPNKKDTVHVEQIGGEPSAEEESVKRPVWWRTAAFGAGDALARWTGPLRSPLGIAWLVAGASTGLLVTAFLWSSDPRPTKKRKTADSNAEQEANAADNQAEESAILPDTIDERMEALGTRLSEFHEEHGHFPAGTRAATDLSVDDRLSWLATLVETQSPKLKGVPDSPWHDPANDRFARRSFAEFLNPALKAKVGPRGLPATHIVGMSGVGEDAARLPRDHSRAGIFGLKRRTRVEDVRDGLTNTILVAGVEDQIGAWSAGGRATMRSLTEEPYIHGPDGFGTGQKDSMFVLMADGSVRVVTSKTEPVILRRMAAMADGLPLDASQGGEPGDLEIIAEAGGNGDEKPGAGNEPNVPPNGDEEPPKEPGENDPPVKVGDEEAGGDEPKNGDVEKDSPIDVAARLEQTIVRYSTDGPRRLGPLVLDLEDLTGVPIKMSEEDEVQLIALMQKQVTVQMEMTTVGKILTALLKQVGLVFRIDEQVIWLELEDTEP